MKFSTRLLLTFPFVIVTYFYLRFSLAENGCSGLMDLFFGGIFFIFFAVSILLAFRATFRKRELYKNKPEPIILTIALITLSALIIGRVFGENFKGSKWIYATNNKTFAKQSLTLRNNETFRVDIGGADISCYFSGRYQKQGDTILLDKTIIEQTHSAFTIKYVLHDSLLVPVFDTTFKNKKFDTLFINLKTKRRATKGLAIGWVKEYQSAVVRYQQQFQQTNKYRLFVFIFGCSFSIG